MEDFRELTLKCEECAVEFLFSVKEQQFYNEKGFSFPKRCKKCREARKEKRDNKITNRKKRTKIGVHIEGASDISSTYRSPAFKDLDLPKYYDKSQQQKKNKLNKPANKKSVWGTLCYHCGRPVDNKLKMQDDNSPAVYCKECYEQRKQALKELEDEQRVD